MTKYRLLLKESPSGRTSVLRADWDEDFGFSNAERVSLVWRVNGREKSIEFAKRYTAENPGHVSAGKKGDAA